MMKYADGSFYEGDFADGLRSGKGTLFEGPDLAPRTGDWRCDVLVQLRSVAASFVFDLVVRRRRGVHGGLAARSLDKCVLPLKLLGLLVRPEVRPPARNDAVAKLHGIMKTASTRRNSSHEGAVDATASSRKFK